LESSHQGALHLPASPSLGNPQHATCAAIILLPFQILLDYHLKNMFPKTNSTNSGNVKGKEIKKSRSEESKEFQRKIQSLRLNLNTIQSNVKDINKILKDLELAYKTKKKPLQTFCNCLDHCIETGLDWSECSSTQV